MSSTISTSGVNMFVISPDELASLTGIQRVRVVDLTDVGAQRELSGVIPGASTLDYSRLVRKQGLTQGLLPSMRDIMILLRESGIGPEDYVVAYDQNTGIRAARFLWMLDVVGHKHYALLNGGFTGWVNTGLPVEDAARPVDKTHYPVDGFSYPLASKNDVFQSIYNSDSIIVDVRGEDEFTGRKQTAQSMGHIPTAIHYEWTNVLAPEKNGRLKTQSEIFADLHKKHITEDKEIIVYCQSNRRSAHTYVVLKWLGYPRVQAYTGSWSEWGNDPALPVEA